MYITSSCIYILLLAIQFILQVLWSIMCSCQFVVTPAACLIHNTSKFSQVVCPCSYMHYHVMANMLPLDLYVRNKGYILKSCAMQQFELCVPTHPYFQLIYRCKLPSSICYCTSFAIVFCTFCFNMMQLWSDYGCCKFSPVVFELHIVTRCYILVVQT